MDGITKKSGPIAPGEKSLLSWEGWALPEKVRSTRWYLITGLVSLAVIAVSVWQKDWFLIGVTVIVTAVIFWYAKTVNPIRSSYQLTPLGIYENGRLFPFSEIHSFWMVYNERVKTLYFVFTKKYLPALTVDIEHVDPVLLRSLLLKKVPEQEKRGESLIDKLVRVLGF